MAVVIDTSCSLICSANQWSWCGPDAASPPALVSELVRFWLWPLAFEPE